MNNKEQKSTRNYLIVILGITYVVCLAIIAILNHFTSLDTVQVDTDNRWTDIKNWVSMVVTLIIPLGIAIVLWQYSNFHQQQSSQILEKSAERRIEKRNIIFPRISLQLKITEQYLENQEFNLSNERFGQMLSMIYAFEESLNSDELNNLVEVLEVGKVFSENRGIFPMTTRGVFPSIFTSIPATLAAFLPQLKVQIQYYSTSQEKLEKCFCGSELPCNIHVNSPQ